MPVINLQMMSGRSQDAKREIVRALTDALCKSAEVTPEMVSIVVTEVEPHHWARAGVFVSDR